MAELSLYAHDRQRQQRGVISPERRLSIRKVHDPIPEACIDLTAYEDERDSNFVSSTFADNKTDDERVSSNTTSYENNVAADAVKNIKTLLDIGDADDVMTTHPMILLARENVRQRNDYTIQFESDEVNGGYDGPIRLWASTSEEPPRPERVQRKEPKSEYHMAKQRLILSRRDRNSYINNTTNSSSDNKIANQSATTDIVDLTRKHEELIQMSTDYRNQSNASALLEIINIDNDLPLSSSPPMSSPQSITSNTNSRLLIDTGGGMEKRTNIMSQNTNRNNDDLASAFAYEFKKNDVDETSDIIVLDDILFQTNEVERNSPSHHIATDPSSLASQNVAARFEAIRNSVANRLLNLERTHAHPLATALTEDILESDEPDLIPPELQVISDKINSLHQKQDKTDEAKQIIEGCVNVTMHQNEMKSCEPPPPEDPVRSPSRTSVIEGLMIPPIVQTESRQSTLKGSDDFFGPPLRAESEYRKKIQSNITAISALRSTVKMDDEKVESDFIAITKNLTPSSDLSSTMVSKLSPKKVEHGLNTVNPVTTDTPNNNIPQDQSLDPIFESVSEVIGDTQPNNEIILKESPAILTAAELCVGFCDAKAGDTISVLPDTEEEVALRLNNVNALPTVKSDYSDTFETISTCDEPFSNPPNDNEESKPNTNKYSFADAQPKSQSPRDCPSKKHEKDLNMNDLALSDDDSSTSYPSDVDVNNGLMEHPYGESSFKKQNSVRSFSLDSKSQWSKSTAAATTISNGKKDVDVSGSENASFISDNSETRDSDNSDSDLDEETGIYDACFARHLLDDACGWLEHDESSFCFKPSLLKKVKRRNTVGTKKYYGRSPLLLRVPRNQILTRNYLKARRRPNEKLAPVGRKKNKAEDYVQTPDNHITPLRNQQNKKIIHSDDANIIAGALNAPDKSDKKKIIALHRQESVGVLVSKNSNGQKDVGEKKLNDLNAKIQYFPDTESGIFEVDSKNSAIFEVKSAEEYTSPHFSAYQEMLRTRSMSPTSFQPVAERNILKAQVSERLKVFSYDHKVDRKSGMHAHTDVAKCPSRDNISSVMKTASIESKLEKSKVQFDPIDCTEDTSDLPLSLSRCDESPKSLTGKELGDVEFLTRPVSRREGLAKLRYQKPTRHDLIQLEHIGSVKESAVSDTVLNEEQRLASLDSAEKLRRRATTLRRRRKIRERRRDSKWTESQHDINSNGRELTNADDRNNESN